MSDADPVDQIILALRDEDRRQGRLVQDFNRWQPYAEAVRNAGYVNREEVLDQLNAWTPVFNFSSLNRLSDEDRATFERELETQAEQARHDLMRALEGE